MKLYKVTITPQSNFATTLKGDTIFGHICWAIVYLYKEKRLQSLLNKYKDNSPFLIVSDAFAKDYLPKPILPFDRLNEKTKNIKEVRKKIWITLDNLQNQKFNLAKKEDVIFKTKNKEIEIVRNSINYTTFTTDGDNFAPYSQKEFKINPQDIYFLLDEEQFSLQELKESLELISQIGFGKDSTIGKGRFSFDEFIEIKLNFKAKSYMTLSPFSIKSNDKIDEIFYEPFVRFGKFGGNRANQNAFKKPILLANSASFITFEKIKERFYIGEAIANISDTFTDAVQQGYSILLPIKDK